MTSRRKHTWVLIVCVVALVVLIFAAPAFGWRLQAWLGAKNLSLTNSATATEANDEILKAQLASLQNVSAQLPQAPANTIRAMVYAQYPFGFKNELLVNAGSNEGVATGSAVTFQGIFVGTVQNVFSESAAIQTVFDPNFKMPVRIGSSGVDALLVGGAYPEATSIAKGTPIENGDIVYTAAPGLPYGVPIGIVNTTSTSPDNLFEQASVNFAYEINDVQTVFIGN